MGFYSGVFYHNKFGIAIVFLNFLSVFAFFYRSNEKIHAKTAVGTKKELPQQLFSVVLSFSLQVGHIFAEIINGNADLVKHFVALGKDFDSLQDLVEHLKESVCKITKFFHNIYSLKK